MRSEIFKNPHQRDHGFWKILSNSTGLFFNPERGYRSFFKNYPITTGSLPNKLPGNVVPHGLTALMQTAIGQGSKRKKAVMDNTKN
jgi:hypothetical protein